jgi:hypothetical protein
MIKRTLFVIIATLALVSFFLPDARAHNVSKNDAKFVQANQVRAMGPFIYLGAKHMVTGYDHLLFLVGVIFFLYRLKDVVQYVSLFTIGHSVTLLVGVLGGVHANSYIIDAINWFIRRVQSVRQHRWLQTVSWNPAEYEVGSFDFRFIPRFRTGDEASGVRAVSKRTGGEHRQLQCRRRNRPGACADRGSHCIELLADSRRLSAARIRDQHSIDDGRLYSDGLSARRIYLDRITGE